MSDFKRKLQIFKERYLPLSGILLLMVLAVFLLWLGNTTSTQSQGAAPAKVYFEGEYCINGGESYPIEKGKHIPSTKGDVTLRLNFYLMDPHGNPMNDRERIVPISLYTDHIGLTFYSGDKITRVIDNENPIIGEPACAENWTMHPVKAATSEPTVIVVRNPHRFGNENAIDQMLANIDIWENADFEKEILKRGEPQRNVGMIFILLSVVFLGIAFFSSLIHIKSSKVIWLLGVAVLFAGLYITYSEVGVSFRNESVVSNTIIQGCSMMFYMLFLSISISCFFRSTKKVGELTVILLGVADALCLLLPIVSNIFFYNTKIFWVIAQLSADIVLFVCLIREFLLIKEKVRWLYIGALLPLIAFSVDVLGTLLGAWQGGVVSGYVFVALLAVAMVIVLKFIPQSINAATKAKELEMEKIVLNAELAESRIATMMSQIRPHFIYNTLGSIEQLCKLNPPKAGELVHNFAKYLRGNFGELDNPKPILMSQEMEHVRHYINIENVRFPDMTFTFEMNSSDFHIPALTVQPIVENAIKHGLMKLPKGGTIHVVSYETDTEYCICVVDDGVGFDTGVLIDERTHLGLRNIRERLKVMVNGNLKIESTIGVGTKVLVTIPKEGKQ